MSEIENPSLTEIGQADRIEIVERGERKTVEVRKVLIQSELVRIAYPDSSMGRLFDDMTKEIDAENVIRTLD